MEEGRINLDKVDLIRQRLGVSYREAKEALEQANGDVVQALVILEDRQFRLDEKIEDGGKRFWGQIKGIIRKGNVNRIRLKKGERVLVEIPVNVGALGVVGMVALPPLAILGVAGTLTALATNCTLEIERPDGTIEEQNIEID
ncbi:MAG: DUF4342 domain-containing protein [Syntrophomonadaceae bacterium]|mgnify:CR=1 FL=1|nr:DUF4342 domain-containing protein [Syntrophomonadaceae bacterium]